MIQNDQPLDRYKRETPYDILGLPPSATAKELTTRCAVLQRDVRESAALDSSEKTRQGERYRLAQEQVSTGAERVRVDFFLLDPQVSLAQCQTIAASVPKPETNVKELVKPKQIRLTHEAFWPDLESMRVDPLRMEGLHVRPMASVHSWELPEPLKIQFDC